MSAYESKVLRFVFKIDFIVPNYDEQCEIRLPNQAWIPPTIPSAVKTVGSTGWYRWTPAGIERTECRGEKFRVCSLFYNSECYHFLGVPFDCRQKSVQQSRRRDGIGWRRVMFQYLLNDPYPPISVMRFDVNYNVLAGKGSDSWMPQLIPETYNQNQEDYDYSNTGIAGDLSLLLAFAAFSCPHDAYTVLEVIRLSFKPPIWNRHNLPASRRHGTGVVVSIHLDSDSNITAQDLRNIEEGKNGPIIQA
ncbi:hypothetical protein D8B26_006151 [Coccidioides posadasii str. Silveira]|uniref:Uncharacterized protein n=1 Tax=Coccidioides posadasii (strain RMSCC 757 / Silveira) TaxID=443226 RepID=E9DBH6_COCPS|nr:conserved hypothetical protein [Coccidioides posadasii str. Silveira]QVM11504.1 hypothetical protein D8B26_006151 [Coccidioides posadasii str. Silveira]